MLCTNISRPLVPRTYLYNTYNTCIIGKTCIITLEDPLFSKRVGIVWLTLSGLMVNGAMVHTEIKVRNAAGVREKLEIFEVDKVK